MVNHRPAIRRKFAGDRNRRSSAGLKYCSQEAKDRKRNGAVSKQHILQFRDNVLGIPAKETPKRVNPAKNVQNSQRVSENALWEFYISDC